MRRLLTGSLAVVALTGTVLVLPVYASPGPEAEPVPTSTEEVAMGSVEDPAPAADVQDGTSEPVTGVAETTPTLTVTKTDVPEFSLVGVTWAFDPAVTDTVVKVRVQDDAGAWGEWTEVGTEDADQDPGADAPAAVRGGTAPLWTGPSTGVEAELVTRSGAAPTDVQLDLVDPGDSAADANLGTPDIQDTADAALAMPDVYSRAQWGADERKMTWGPEYAPTLKAATLHHTAGSNAYTADQVPSILRGIYEYHAVQRGWGDIGYNVLVDKFGRRWEGRAGGLSRTVVGAHAGGFNTGTFGVSMMGTYESLNPPQAVVDSVAAIIAWKFSLYGVNPRGTTTLVSGGGGTAKYARGVSVTLPTIFGHRDVGNTTCPGNAGYARLGEIRDQVTAKLSSAVPLVRQRYDGDAALRAMLGDVVTPPTRTPDGMGAYAHYEHGSIYATHATGARVLRGSIYSKWAALDWERSPLGYPVSDVGTTPDGQATYAHFERGSIYSSRTGGTRWLGAAIRDAWGVAGWEGGRLGYPTSDQRSTPDGKGAYVHFQGGSIYWSQASGAHAVFGPVRDAWQATRWEKGPLGFPVSGVGVTPDGVGQYAHFQGGSIYWTRATGGRWLGTAIRDAWGATGWEGGRLGYPTSSQRSTPDGKGAYVHFQGGSIYWSKATGAHAVFGPVRDAWKATGWETGPLGFPTTDVGSTAGGVGQFVHFQGGSIYWTPDTGAQWLGTAIRDAWEASGWEYGPLGYPTSSQRATPDGLGAYVHFQGGSIYWSKATGAHVVRGAVRDVWKAQRWEKGELGYPTSDVRTTPDGVAEYAHFQGGSIYATQAFGAHALSLAVRQAWADTGWEKGRLGYPTSDAYPVTGGSRTDFQGGYITVRTGATTGTVTYSS